MSGSKRKSQYRKSVTTNYLHTNITLDEGDDIAKIICSRGANLFEIEVSEDEKNGLGLLPNKFRNLIWIKRNDFVIVTTTSELDNVESAPESVPKAAGAELLVPLKRFEIKEILNAEHIKHLRSSNQWPAKFKDLNFGTGVKVAANISYPDDIMDNESEEDDVSDDEVRDRFGNTISKDSEEEEEEEVVAKIEIQKDIVTVEVEGVKEVKQELEKEQEQEERDEYEEESDDERHVEYGDDSAPVDACCMNNNPTAADITCSLCTVRDT